MIYAWQFHGVKFNRMPVAAVKGRVNCSFCSLGMALLFLLHSSEIKPDITIQTLPKQIAL